MDRQTRADVREEGVFCTHQPGDRRTLGLLFVNTPMNCEEQGERGKRAASTQTTLETETSSSTRRGLEEKKVMNRLLVACA